MRKTERGRPAMTVRELMEKLRTLDPELEIGHASGREHGFVAKVTHIATAKTSDGKKAVALCSDRVKSARANPESHLFWDDAQMTLWEADLTEM